MTNDQLSLFVLTYLLLNATATLNLDKYRQPSIKNVVGYRGSSKQGCPYLSTERPSPINALIIITFFSYIDEETALPLKCR